MTGVDVSSRDDCLLDSCLHPVSIPFQSHLDPSHLYAHSDSRSHPHPRSGPHSRSLVAAPLFLRRHCPCNDRRRHGAGYRESSASPQLPGSALNCLGGRAGPGGEMG
jgi:hypothetical protein